LLKQPEEWHVQAQTAQRRAEGTEEVETACCAQSVGAASRLPACHSGRLQMVRLGVGGGPLQSLSSLHLKIGLSLNAAQTSTYL
jgi:hypothetical protein